MAIRARWYQAAYIFVHCMCLPALARWSQGHTHQYYQDRGRVQKWYLRSTPSPERVTRSTCTSNRCLTISKWIFFTYSLGTFQTTAFVLFPQVNESIYQPFQRSISVSYSLLGLLDMSPIGFPSQAHLFIAGPQG